MRSADQELKLSAMKGEQPLGKKQKKAYASPVLTVHGDVKKIVQSGTQVPDEGDPQSGKCNTGFKANPLCTG